MKTLQISLNSIDKVKSFVNDITKFDCDFDLVSGRYVIDAKSIMGIFSLDLSKDIDLNNIEEQDFLSYVLNSNLVCEAGERYLYNNAETFLLSRSTIRFLPSLAS